jgi:hypothetical protein
MMLAVHCSRSSSLKIDSQRLRDGLDIGGLSHIATESSRVALA